MYVYRTLLHETCINEAKKIILVKSLKRRYQIYIAIQQENKEFATDDAGAMSSSMVFLWAGN